MNLKTQIKLIISSVLVTITAFGLLILTLYIIPNDVGLVLGIILGFAFMCLVIAYGFPVWFKDYIKEFWEKEEAKKNEEDIEE